jgi:hypothetical protein
MRDRGYWNMRRRLPPGIAPIIAEFALRAAFQNTAENRIMHEQRSYPCAAFCN